MIFIFRMTMLQKAIKKNQITKVCQMMKEVTEMVMEANTLVMRVIIQEKIAQVNILEMKLL